MPARSARAFAAMFEKAAPDPAVAARIIADACTLPDVCQRHARDGQRLVDAAAGTDDDDFLRLCAYDDVASIVGRYELGPSPWLMG